MTVEQRQNLALSGDVEAMIFLADFNLHSRSLTDGEEAEKYENEAKKWFQMAADYGEPYAVYMLCVYKMSEASQAETEISHIGAESVKEKWLEAYTLCSRLSDYFQQKKQGMEKLKYADVLSRLKKCIYRLAIYKFCTNENADDILSCLVDVEDPKVAVFRGVVLFNKAAAPNEYNDALNLMMHILDADYISAEKTDIEFELFAYAAVNLSKCCALGLGMAKNVNMGFDVLTYGKHYIETEKGLNIVRDELKLYECQADDERKYVGGLK